MSALARYFLNKGIEIFGYDLTQSSLTKKLEAEGMMIHYSEDLDKIPKDIDLVVYTPAIPQSNREFVWLNENNYIIKKRAEVLGLISKQHSTIAVAGTHGKTSTSSLIAHILTYCGLDISAFLGGILKQQNSNYIQGNSDIVVLEADEYDRSFLQIYPDILIITSLDADHLDIYKSHRSMIDAYEQFISQISIGGTLILMDDFSNSFSFRWKDSIERNGINVLQLNDDFGFENVRISDTRYVFDFKSKESSLNELISIMPGLHNISNVCASVMVAILNSCSSENIKEALHSFKGIKRRFEVVYEDKKVLLDDYAHHPTELKNAVETVNRLYAGRSIIGIFQPHLYSRTADFYQGFARELEALDEIWILDIYPAREEPIEGIKSEMIFNLIRNDNKRLLHTSELVEALRKEKENLDVVITLGASDIDKYHNEIVEILK